VRFVAVRLVINVHSDCGIQNYKVLDHLQDILVDLRKLSVELLTSSEEIFRF
jgi:hypothetical protein